MEKMKIKREEKNHKKGVIIIRSSFFFNVEMCVCVFVYLGLEIVDLL